MKRIPLLLALVLVPAAARAQTAADTLRWTILFGGRHAGQLAAWTRPDGTLAFHSAYNDRGRGPDIVTEMRLGPRGTPVWEHSQGVDYLKAPVQETFTIRDGRATWSNGAETGDQRPAGPAFFVGMYDVGDYGVMARALLAAPGHALPMLPGGTVTLERIGALRVSAGGRTQNVVGYRLLGTGFEPTTFWMTPDNRFFAQGGGWGGTIRARWEDALPQIARASDAADAARYAMMARTLARRPAHPLAFRNVAVYDPEARVRRPGMTVVVSGGRIQAVGPVGSVAVPAGADVIDGAGRMLLPGLWDMHTHNGPLDGLMHLAAGVTTVRDMGNDTTILKDLRSKWDSGAQIGPHLIVAGFIDGPGPFTAPTGFKVSTSAQALAAVDAYKRLGAEQIKVYSSLDTALLPVIIRRAHELGMRVSGHIPWPLTAERGVRLGMDEIQHANFLVLNFLGDTIDTRTPARFTQPAARAADLDLASPQVQAFVQLLKDRHVAVDPTLNAFEEMFTARVGALDPVFAAVAERVPPPVRRGWLVGGLPVPEGMDARYRESFRRMLQLTALLHRSGVPIVAGTDALSGFAYHRELELYAQAGIPPADVLYIATLGAARLMHHDARSGSIAVGKDADLVLVDGDPTTNVSDVRRTRLVVKAGTVYDPARLYAAIGVSTPPATR